MDKDFPPLVLVQPQTARRRPEKPRRGPLPADVLAERALRAARIGESLRPLSTNLQALTPEQRRTVFLKLEHDRPLSLSGTDLKVISEASDHVTLALPRQSNLAKLEEKVRLFGTSEVKNGHVAHEELAPLRHVSLGQPKDRLSEALFNAYDSLTSQEWVICEIELISYETGSKKRRKELSSIRGEISELFGSSRGNFFEHEEIGGSCRAVVRCTGEVFKALVEGRDWQTKVVWFSERPRFETFMATRDGFRFEDLDAPTPPPPGAPIVCVVDSGVSPGNPFLAPVCRNELLHSFLPENPSGADENGHGSGVASLIAYYSINIAKGGANVGRIWIAGARVLNAQNENHDRLFSKVLEEVVLKFQPEGVRIFNLAVGIVNQPWNLESKRTVQRKSWIARAIDRISREHDVVFVVSAGNISYDDVSHFYSEGKPYPLYLTEEQSRILDPAQASLALTVGSIAPTTLVVGPGGKTSAVALEGQPSPFTRSGPGINKEIKPELVEFGGNYVIDDERKVVRRNLGTDVVMASHQLSPAIALDAGTSYAAPRVAHILARILDDLQDLMDGPVSAPLLKAFCVSSATEPGYLGEDAQNDAKFSRTVSGYGRPDFVRATHCDEHSVVLFFQGEISPDAVVYFDIPVPASLAQRSSGRIALDITVSHYPEVQRSGLERYLGTILKWRVFRGDISRESVIKAMSEEADDEGAEQSPPRPDELQMEPGITLRSRGAVQRAVTTWNRHAVSHSEGHYTLAIAAYRRWDRELRPVPFGVVVRLEDLARGVALYTEVEQALARLRVRAAAAAGD